MSFRDNLQHLRDTRSMNQTELAQLLGVSRQSVAKWEAEKSYPEMDKLIKLCDLFDCSLDDLVRGDLTGCAPMEEEPPSSDTIPREVAPKNAQVVDECGYDEHMRRRVWDIAAGVAVIIMGFGVSLFVTGGRMADSVPIVVVNLASCALGVFLFVSAHRAHKAFCLEHPAVVDFYTSEQKAEARRRKARGVVGGVAVAVLAFFTPGILGFFNPFHGTLFANLSVFGCFALGAALVVYFVLMDHRMDVARYCHVSHDETSEVGGAGVGASTALDTTT